MFLYLDKWIFGYYYVEVSEINLFQNKKYIIASFTIMLNHLQPYHSNNLVVDEKHLLDAALSNINIYSVSLTNIRLN